MQCSCKECLSILKCLGVDTLPPGIYNSFRKTGLTIQRFNSGSGGVGQTAYKGRCREGLVRQGNICKTLCDPGYTAGTDGICLPCS